jgi:RNA polymerase sigma factor (sigma-70 family)
MIGRPVRRIQPSRRAAVCTVGPARARPAAEVPTLTHPADPRAPARPLTATQRAQVAENVNLARWAVRRCYPDVRPGGPDYEDAVGVASLGLVHAARRFDPARSAFGTYAFLWCRAYLNRWWQDRARGGLRQADGSARISRLDSDDRRPFRDSLPAPVTDPDALLDVEAVLAGLSPKARATLTLTFLEGRSLAEAGRELGLTGERVRQIRRRVVGLLRARFESAV